MIDKERLDKALFEYKEAFVSRFVGRKGSLGDGEKFKWEAVKWFQENWKIDAPDFKLMLEQSLSRAGSLLNSRNNFPERMIEGFAEKAPEEVRLMFINLYDEGSDLLDRIASVNYPSSQNPRKPHNSGKFERFPPTTMPEEPYFTAPSAESFILQSIVGDRGLRSAADFLDRDMLRSIKDQAQETGCGAVSRRVGQVRFASVSSPRCGCRRLLASHCGRSAPQNRPSHAVICT